MKTTISEKWNKEQSYECEIERNKSIKIDCFYKNAVNPRPTSVTFKMGDTAEYGSYNLHYLGKITGITEKTVTIADEDCPINVKRLKLGEFCWRNWDFNLEKITAYNHEESMCI